MPSCCYRDEYGELFSEREATRTARRFRRKGLRGSAQRLADAVIAAGVDGASILEVGGGVGHVHTRLLQAGAARAVNVELSPGWEAAARDLLFDLGLEDRVERRLGDVVDEAGRLPEADVVVLHRVLCCYPGWREMSDAAVSRTRRVLAITLPVDRWWTRAAIGAGNLLFRLRGRDFRAYVHPVADVLERVRAAGFRVVHDHRGLVWRSVVLESTDRTARRRRPA